MARDGLGRDGHVDEATVHAWLDGALAPEEAARVAAHVEGCAACAAEVAEARGLIAASSRILSALDHVPADVVPARRRASVAWYRGWPVRVAASVVVAVVGGLVVADRMHLVAPAAAVRDAPVVPSVAPPVIARVPDSAGPPPSPSSPLSPPLRTLQTSPAVATSRARAESQARAKVAAPVSPVPMAAPMAAAPMNRAAGDASPMTASPAAPVNGASDAPVSPVSPVAADSVAPARAAFSQLSRAGLRAAARPSAAGVTSSSALSAKQAGDSIARAGCYDVEAPVAGALPRRIVLDTTSVGDSGLMRRVARVAPPDSARVAYWIAPAPDSVEVVISDGPTLAGRVTPRGWNGAAAGVPFTARRCGPR